MSATRQNDSPFAIPFMIPQGSRPAIEDESLFCGLPDLSTRK